MTFDPDQYLSEKEENAIETPAFDPDAYLAEKDATFKMGGVAGETVEAVSGFNRAMFDMIDFLGIDNVNALLEISGSEKRLPTTRQMFGEEPGAFGSDVSAAFGETAALAAAPQDAVRTLASRVPQKLSSTVSRILQQAGKESIPAATVLGGVSGAGAEIGQDVTDSAMGALVGGVAAPVGFSAVGSLLNAGARGIQSLTSSLRGMSDEGASELLATAMIREGLSPDDVTRKLQELGPDAIPADVGNNFARLLRAASNQIPRLEGRAKEVLDLRQKGQADRILSSMDDATGTSSMNISDEIIRLNEATKPEINRLYAEVKSSPIEMSPKLKSLITGDSAAGRAQSKVKLRLANKRAAGEEISNMDLIDATKQELDDQIGKSIRQGEMNTARDLVGVKNALVEEADAAVPQYKEARNLFAGKAQLENAGEMGKDFFKIKASDMPNFVETMSGSEKRMFKLGAKQAILDRLDNINVTADGVKRLFGKTGDVKKLRSLFDDRASFDKFNNTLEREAQFVLTRRAAQANSTTAKQLTDQADAIATLNEARQAFTDPVEAAGLIGRISARLKGAKGSADHTQALEEVGDILLATDMNPDKLRTILMKGSEKDIARELEKASKRMFSGRQKLIGGGAPVAFGVLTETQERTQE